MTFAAAAAVAAAAAAVVALAVAADCVTGVIGGLFSEALSNAGENRLRRHRIVVVEVQEGRHTLLTAKARRGGGGELQEEVR